MCHSLLQVDVGPLINFIIGHNGSGKSAVLTALTVCLGGKASATNRASSLKSFIKEGTEYTLCPILKYPSANTYRTCTLSVKIKNGGDDGYQQELYGSSIIVERSFSRSGASAFKIKNSSGRIISTKRSDLEDISDYYALQLDNPINVLTQDNSRQFLSGSGPTDKYKFFIRGVQLEQLNRDYDLLHESISQMEATFEDKRLYVEQLRERKEKAKATFELLGHNASIFSKMHFVRSQLAWCQVEEQEDQLRQAEEALRATAAESEAAQEQAADAGQKLSDAEQARDNATVDEVKAQEDVEKVSGELSSAREAQESLKEEALNAQRDERSIDEEINTSRRAIKKTQAEIETEKSRLEEVNGGSIARHMEEMEIKKRAVERSRQLHRDKVAERADITKEQSDIEEDLKHCEYRKRAKIEEKASCEERIRELRNQGPQRNFKPNMDKLLSAIAASKDFREKPIGPIGNYIQLTDPQWLSILERSFGDVLEAFIVTSKSDQARLADLMRRVNCQTSIVIGSQAPIDTSRHEPDPELTTVLRVLRIEKEIIKRQLVINQSIEQTILIPSVKKARELMDRTRLPNVKQCYSHQPHKPNAGERFSYGLGGALNSSFIPPWNKRPRMRTQAEDSIAFEQNQLQRLEREAREINDEITQLKSRAAACRHKLAAHDRQERSLKADIQTAQHLCDEIQEKIDADNIEEGKLDALKQALSDLEQELVHNEKIRNDAVKEKEKHTAKWKAMEPNIRAIEGRGREAETRLKTAKGKTRQREEARQSVLYQKNKLHEVLAKLQSDQSVLEQDKAQLEGVVAEFTDGASEVGPRVPVDRRDSQETLKAKMEKLEEERRNHERRWVYKYLDGLC
jgi:structural maintenance of chromosomes protein 6